MKAYHSYFLILDFGSQYTWLIARCLKELGFSCRVEKYNFSIKKIKHNRPAGIILSGGPKSTLHTDSPRRSLDELASIAPLLGICYGLQLIVQQYGGQISERTKTPKAKNQKLKQFSYGQSSYGKKIISWKKIFPQKRFTVWMSHGDFISKTPKGFNVWATTDQKAPVAIFHPGTLRASHKTYPILAFQFHPEVSHTKNGKKLLLFFAKQICNIQPQLQTKPSLLDLTTGQIKKQIGLKDHVLCALSGGVDSTVTACLLTKVLNASQVHCLFVDTGLLRKDEFSKVLSLYQKMGLNVRGVSAKKMFLTKLKGTNNPERRRKIIGRLFIDVFKNYAKKHSISYLAQGTLYPDVIESSRKAGCMTPKGGSVAHKAGCVTPKGGYRATHEVGSILSNPLCGGGDVIKSHHNVGGLPKNLPFRLVEPLRELFKDEVRVLGKRLKIPKDFLDRHPFPGPGLAVRIEGELSNKRLEKLRHADAIYIEELSKFGLYNRIWQAFCILLDSKSVGVQGDRRTYQEVIVLRAVTSRNGMTADWFPFSSSVLHAISDRITNEVSGVGRVLYDISSKPPGTIEWM